MKRNIKLVLNIVLIGLTTLLVCGQEDNWYLKFNEDDLFNTGRSLSFGGVLTNDLKIDTSQINPKELELKAIQSIGRKVATLELGLSGIPYVRRCGIVMSIIDLSRALWNAWRVGTGRADPEVLRSTIPHVVQAWDALKGPQNLSTQNFTTRFNYHYNDAAWKIQAQSTRTFCQNFSTTALGKIGNYGFNPFTDTIIRKTTTKTIQRETFEGARFNKIYHNQPLTTSAMSTYSPPPIPTYTPPKFYNPAPSSSFTPPTMSKYSPPSIPSYTPPKFYNPAPSSRR